jgi:hypothetical protein
MMNIVKLKGCQRCGGDLILERDIEGTYISCLQCSAVYVKLPLPETKKPQEKKCVANC